MRAAANSCANFLASWVNTSAAVMQGLLLAMISSAGNAVSDESSSSPTNFTSTGSSCQACNTCNARSIRSRRSVVILTEPRARLPSIPDKASVFR